MKLDDIFSDKTLKQKAKVEIISTLVLDKKISIAQLLSFAEKANDTEKATCIESLEFATKKNAGITTEKCLKFVTESLADKVPRVKWESAKVIGNIAHLFPTKLNKVIGNILINSENEGTVVRWAAAFALGEIAKLNTKLNKELLPHWKQSATGRKTMPLRKNILTQLRKA